MKSSAGFLQCQMKKLNSNHIIQFKSTFIDLLSISFAQSFDVKDRHRRGRKWYKVGMVLWTGREGEIGEEQERMEERKEEWKIELCDGQTDI